MRIGIDARYVQDYFPGIGRYTFNLVKALAKVGATDTFYVFYNPKLFNSRFDLRELETQNVFLREVDVPTFSQREQWKLPSIIREEKLDVFHSPYYIKPYLVPCPAVVTIHDASGARFPQYLPTARVRLIYKATNWLASVSSRLVITDSEAAKADISHYFRVSDAKIRVVYPSAGQVVTAQDSGRQVHRSDSSLEPFILYVGIDKPHKNLVNLVKAYAKADIRQNLLIVGRHDPRYLSTRQEVESLGLNDRVRFLGEVSEAELVHLYQSADFFVFPSLCEGFGLPVLEAMQFGIPVIASDTSSLPEVVGDAGLLVDPFNTEGWAIALRSLAENDSLRTELAKRGKERAETFTWERTAMETLAVYKEVCRK